MSSVDKANIFAHHLLMCSSQARIDSSTGTYLYAVANQWASEMPAYHVPLIIKYLQNLCSSNDQLTSFQHF